MFKTCLTVGAFAIGVVCGLMFDGRAHEVMGSTTDSQSPPSTEGRRVFKGVKISNFGSVGLSIDRSVPQFIPIEKTPVFEELEISGEEQALDGLDCRSCTFSDSTLEYGGGAFNFTNVKFSGKTRLVLTGAAANTVAFLQFMHGIDKGIPSASLPPNRPIEKTAITKKPLGKIDFTAPYIGAK
jgi:hypothetical protein